jgi:tRNA 5-methylaminomethyl-2-thiouridine biosynthesis bifunctional protein
LAASFPPLWKPESVYAVFSDTPEDPDWFLGGLELPAKWQSQRQFVLLDTAFSVSRFAAVCAAFDGAPGSCLRLHYLTVCPTGTPAPQPPEDSPPAWQRLLAELSSLWPLPLPGLHQISLLGGCIQMNVAFGETESLVRLFDAVCDAFFLDGLEPVLPSTLARLSRKGSSVFLQSGSQRQADALNDAGFAISSGPFQSSFSGSFRVQKRPTSAGHPSVASEGGRSALIIGAGLAGTAIASALAARNWDVSILEREPVAATGASGNLAAVFSPLLSLDDGRAARLSRACFLRLLEELRSHDSAITPVLWQACGVLQLPKSEKEESHFRELVHKHAYPERYVRFLEKTDAQECFGQVLPSGGWFFEEGGWVNPPSLCAARIGAHPNINIHFGQDVHRLEHGPEGWTALGPAGQRIASAPVLVLANAWEAAHLLPQPGLPFKRVRGQVAHLPPGLVPPIRTVLSKDGYLTPAVNSLHCLGATYDFGSEAPFLDPDAHRLNLERLAGMLPEAPQSLDAPLQGRVGFRSLTPDRMPIVGPLPAPLRPRNSAETPGGEAPPGLFCLLGLGSRGLVWSTLLGEYLAALIEGTPSPLPLDLAAPLSPARFGTFKPANRGSGGPEGPPAD